MDLFSLNTLTLWHNTLILGHEQKICVFLVIAEIVIMMPPKKSKAARGQAEKLEKDGKHNGVEIPERLPPAMDCDDITDEEPRDDAASNSDEKETTEAVNIFRETIVEGKRKRETPPGEKHLQAW